MSQHIYDNYKYMFLAKWMTGLDVPEIWRKQFEDEYEIFDKGEFRDSRHSRKNRGTV